MVPFANFPKAVYLNDETFEASVAVSNYSPEPLINKEVLWELATADGRLVKNGKFSTTKIGIGANPDLGKISASLSEVTKAAKLKLTLHVGDHSNSWDVWVYPNVLAINEGNVIYTRDLEEATDALQKGEKVLYNPNFKRIKGLEGKFVPVFWSPVHFPNQAGTMGLLCDPDHPAFTNFPTDFHSNWQWWDLNKNSRVVFLDSILGANPILINIDNFNRNSSLASVFEARVGEGQLLFCTMDLSTDIESRIVAKQLLFSLLHYMNSGDFNPSGQISPEQIKSLILESEKDIGRGSIYDN